jgi:hypothetical protein
MRKESGQQGSSSNWGKGQHTEAGGSNWEKTEVNKDSSAAGGSSTGKESHGAEDLRSKLNTKTGNTSQHTGQAKTGCDFCGLKNHSSADCKRKNACELCGLSNHIMLL